jgi:required for meiotic nuclear division protein 1
MTVYKVIAYQISDSLDIKGLRGAFKAKLHYSDSDELFYEESPDHYIYIFKYGVVSFFNFEAIEASNFLQFISSFCRNRFTEDLSDAFFIETNAPENRITYNKIDITGNEREVIRMIMLNVSESVALDHYSQQTSRLMEETNDHTQVLEKKGRLIISGTNLKKFIGKTLLLKNRISANLYIFDSPDETWENEQLDKLDSELKKHFELQDRFRNVSEGLSIVKENLELFKDILQYRNSVRLEWVIIVLIAIEVIHFLAVQIF